MEASTKTPGVFCPFPDTIGHSKFSTKFQEIDYYRDHLEQFDRLALAEPEKAADLVFDLGPPAERQLRTLARIDSSVQSDCCYRLARVLEDRFSEVSEKMSEESQWQISQEMLRLARSAHRLGRTDRAAMGCLLGAALRHFHVANASSAKTQQLPQNEIGKTEAYLDVLTTYKKTLREGHFNNADAVQLHSILNARPTNAVDYHHLKKLASLVTCRFFGNLLDSTTQQSTMSLLETLRNLTR